MTGPRSRIGELLREWRGTRRMSQLGLALEAHVSARHVSFIETGRSRPTREMVLRLAEVLDVPLRDRNLMLDAAGFAPHYGETSWHAPELEPVRRAVERILAHQEPYPAVVMDRHWNILRANEAADGLFGRMIDLATVPPPANVLRLMFDPAGVRPYVVNWPEVARALLGRIAREAVCGVPDAGLRELQEELLAYPGVAAAAPSRALTTPTLPVIPVRFRKAPFEAAYFSTLTTLGTPQDIALQEIRIECFFPAEGA